MRVLVMVHSWPGRGLGYPEGAGHCAGAEMTAYELMRRLAGRGHEVDVLLSSQVGEPYELGGCRIWPHESPGDPFRWFGSEAPPHLVISYLENTTRAGILCRLHAIPFVHLVHNTFEFTKRCIARGPADLVTYHADWVQADYQDFYDDIGLTYPESIMVHPFVDPADYRPGHDGPHDHITLVNVWPNKGSGMFWELAARFPDQRFLGVMGGYGDQDIRDLPNVELIQHVPAARMATEVYARTRVLLMPSTYESYGRTAVEASCAGVPVIANPTPGLREALGEHGIFVDLDDVDGWAAAVTKLLDGRRWAAARRRADAVARRQHPLEDADAWCARAEEVAGHVPALAGAGP